RFFTATNESIDIAQRDPDIATKALMTAWGAAPSEDLVRKTIEATSASLISPPGKPHGWTEEKSISDAQELILSTEEGATRKPSSDFYTNSLLQ
ncbi:ABC transporter substrate-binding protein, partial [Rhizobiaceae sp. 2RAB30]